MRYREGKLIYRNRGIKGFWVIGITFLATAPAPYITSCLFSSYANNLIFCLMNEKIFILKSHFSFYHINFFRSFLTFFNFVFNSFFNLVLHLSNLLHIACISNTLMHILCIKIYSTFLFS